MNTSSQFAARPLPDSRGHSTVLILYRVSRKRSGVLKKVVTEEKIVRLRADP